MRKLSNTGLREVEVTVMVPEDRFAIDVATSILMALRTHPPDLAIHVKICAVPEEDVDEESGEGLR